MSDSQEDPLNPSRPPARPSGRDSDNIHKTNAESDKEQQDESDRYERFTETVSISAARVDSEVDSSAADDAPVERFASYETAPYSHVRHGAGISGGQSALSAGKTDNSVVDLGPLSTRYRDVQKVGEGSFGTVYRAIDSVLKRPVAIKVLKPNVSASFLERFQCEAQRMAMMDHPGICKIYDFSCDQQSGLLITEWLSGQSLADIPMPIAPVRACQLVAEIAEAVAHAHSHEIIHRDLKPANIMLDARQKARVIDFGLSADENELSSTESGFGGSPAYMAPEQTTGRLHILDGRVDVWAMGVILYELVTGKRPFRGHSSIDLLSKIREKPAVSPRTFAHELPSELEQIILKCLAKKPTDRFATAAELAEVLRQAEATFSKRSGLATASSPNAIPSEENTAPSKISIRSFAIITIPVIAIFLIAFSVATYREKTAAINSQSLLATVPKSNFQVVGRRPNTGQSWTIGSDALDSPDIRPDDQISLRVTLPSPRHIYLIWLGGDTGTTFLYPGPLGSTRDVGNPSIDRPTDELLLPVGSITATPSTETVIMIASDIPLSGSAQAVELMNQMPRPELHTFVPPGLIRGMHFNADTWTSEAETPVLMRDAFRPLNEYIQATFSGRASMQAVSFVSGDI